MKTITINDFKHGDILRLLPTFSFPTSETEREYYS